MDIIEQTARRDDSLRKVVDLHPTLERVRDLTPAIREAAPDIERSGRLPVDLLAALKSAGVFRMYVSRRHGGDEVTALDGVLVLEELARADGSVGWLCAIGTDTPAMLSILPQATYEQIYADGPDVVMAGSAIPRGSAVPVEGGYLFTGQWPFASGCFHADYLNIVSPVRQLRADPPRIVSGLVPAGALEILDTWVVSGLRGTGSHDLAGVDVFVPTEWTGSYLDPPPVIWHPLDRIATLGRLGIQLGSIATGIARGAVDDLVEIGRVKRPLGGLAPRLAETPAFQRRLGQLDLDLRIARTLLHDQARRLWQVAIEGRDLDQRELLDQRTVLGRIGELAAGIVEGCFRAAGTTALFEGHPLQRRHRDVNAVLQHLMFSMESLTPSGALLLGEPAQARLLVN